MSLGDTEPRRSLVGRTPGCWSATLSSAYAASCDPGIEKHPRGTSDQDHQKDPNGGGSGYGRRHAGPLRAQPRQPDDDSKDTSNGSDLQIRCNEDDRGVSGSLRSLGMLTSLLIACD